MDVRESGLRKLRDVELKNIAVLISQKANEHVGDLADYGITAEKLNAFKAKVDAYAASIEGFEGGATTRVGTTKTLLDLFNQADEILGEDIDRMMDVFKVNDTEFYNLYSAAAVIKGLGIRHHPTPPQPAPAPVTEPAKTA